MSVLLGSLLQQPPTSRQQQELTALLRRAKCLDRALRFEDQRITQDLKPYVLAILAPEPTAASADADAMTSPDTRASGAQE